MDRAALARLEARLGEARAAWPSVSVPDEQFVRYVSERIPPEANAGDTVERCHVSDLYLVCGCALGQRAALDGFERHFLSRVGTYVARIDRNAAFADDVRQELRQRLFVPAGGRARIEDYSGHGPLARWLRVAAQRTALNLRRGVRPTEPLEETALFGVHPELAHMRGEIDRVLAESLRAALTRLDVRERNILRLHYVDGLSTPQIAALFRTHRTTIRRQINESQERALSEVRKELRRRLKLSEPELDSLLRAASSHLDISLSLLFAED
jgi:RNA polymerase sigma-70 factor, ECF subfamily